VPIVSAVVGILRMAFQWYAIQVYSGSEQAVKRGIENIAKEYKLEDKISSVIVPTEEVIEVKNGEKKIQKEPYIQDMYLANFRFRYCTFWHKISKRLSQKVSRFYWERG